MSTLVLADIHGNLPALEAVLAHPAAKRCTDIVSLGDHVNFGPQSRAVHDRLIGLGATMLLGNHEERLLRPADAEFDGYNWRLMRWTAETMRGADLILPTDVQRGPVLFTHGTPGEPYHLVYAPDLPDVLDALPVGVELLLSGHNHHRWDVCHNGRRAVNPGSVGMAEDGKGGVAPFLVLEGTEVTRYEAAYDVNEVARAFVTTGAYQELPMLCRGVLQVMRTAEYQGGLKLIRHVAAVGKEMGLTIADEAAWLAADATHHWVEAKSTEAFWKDMEEKFL